MGTQALWQAAVPVLVALHRWSHVGFQARCPVVQTVTVQAATYLAAAHPLVACGACLTLTGRMRTMMITRQQVPPTMGEPTLPCLR
jgi:hypothetical protein